MPGPLADPGGAAPPLTLGLDPGTAALQFAVALPDRNWTRQRPHDSGVSKTEKAGTGWSVAPVNGRGRRRGAGRRRCPPWCRPQEAPGRGQELGDGAPKADPRYPARPRQQSRCHGQGTSPFRPRSPAGTTTGRAADPRTTANLSHSPEPTACRNPPFRFFSPAMGAHTGPEPAQGGPGKPAKPGPAGPARSGHRAGHPRARHVCAAVLRLALPVVNAQAPRLTAPPGNIKSPTEVIRVILLPGAAADSPGRLAAASAIIG